MFDEWIDALAARLTPPSERRGRDVDLAPGALPKAQGPDRIALSGADVFVATLHLPTGASIARMLPTVAPIAPDQLVWKAKRAAGGPRTMRIAMARRKRIAEIAATYPETAIDRPTIVANDGGMRFIFAQGGAGSSAAARATLAALLIALVLILTIPLTTLIGAKLLAYRQQTAIRAVEQAGGGALVAKREAATGRLLAEQLRPAIERPTIGAVIGQLSTALPEGAHLASVSRDANGRLVVEVEAIDPDPVRAALASLGLKATGQRPVTDRGIRSRFEGQQ
jgi:hypothetical protein